jgi:tetratricopeptide (TPR) repeat protein
MNDKALDPAQASEHERALVESALREAGTSAKPPAGPSAGHPPSIRARLGGSPFTLPPTDTFPGYELLRELHRGGQGVVYQAIQKTTRRKVAIKVMREGPFASQREHARFEREAQILGQLNHAGIVAIHDSGMTHQSLSYFVMDYISGAPLDVYMSSVKGSVEDALRMLVQICEAVSAAHLKGIIHRDLKPGNIIVDGEGHPHILDFGLAKVAGGDTTGGNGGGALQLMTITGQFLGSMPWASPEQAEGRSEKVDVRSDVYSLGVLLYQVLTGRFPYEVVGNMREVLDNILNAQPAPLRKIKKQITEDAERIVLKCLAKERERRYQSAAELVRDIHHYLDKEPIEARRDSITYVLGMHLRRHKLAVAIILPFIIAAAAGSVTSAIMWGRAVREKAEATALTHFLERTVKGANPKNARNKDRTVVQMLDDAADLLERGELEKEPAVKAAAHAWVGNTLLTVRDAPKAERHLRAALEIRERLYGDKDLKVAEVRASLGRALIERDRLEEADGYLRRALEVQEKRLGPNDKVLATSLNGMGVLRHHQNKYDEAERLFQRAIAIHLYNGDKADLAPVYYNMAALMDDNGSLEKAAGYYSDSRRLYTEIMPASELDTDPEFSFLLTGLGWNLTRQGRACEAIESLERSLKIRERIYQDDDWYRPWTQSCLGDALANCKAADREADAERFLVQSWEALRNDKTATAWPKNLAKERVISFYESRGNKAKAAEYRVQK